jgi:hypothetical protein
MQNSTSALRPILFIVGARFRGRKKLILSLFTALISLSAIQVLAQNTPKSLVLTEKSNVPAKDILRDLQKDCPNVSFTADASKSDYVLDAIKTTSTRPDGRIDESFDLTLLDRDGKTIRSSSGFNFGNSVKDVCRAIKTVIVVEVVDTQNLTQSTDARGDSSGGAVKAAVNGLTGRRTHTDTSTIYVVVNGEHATLDCYERRTGCTTIGPGKYYGELDGESLWVNYEMPLTHKAVRNHYKVAGSW